MRPLPHPSRALLVAALALGALALASQARAEPHAFRVAQRDGKAGIGIELPYSLGTHRAEVGAAEGEVLVDPRSLAVPGGRLAIPIAAMGSEDATRDCHMREALGLDYARSRFPGDHVCRDDRLPAAGPDAVAFPEIVLEVTGARALDDPALLAQGKEVRAEADAAFTIHGVKRRERLELTVAPDPSSPDALRVRGRHAFRLADYGVAVKSARFLFVVISVGERATVDLDVRLVPAAEPTSR